MNIVRALVAACSVTWLFACMIPAQAADTLYQRLGGYDAIAGFVDTAFPRVATNPQLSHESSRGPVEGSWSGTL